MSIWLKTVRHLNSSKLPSRLNRAKPAITPDLCVWIEKNGHGAVRSLPPSSPRPRTPPKALDDFSRDILTNWEPKSIRERCLIELTGATLFGRDAFLILPDGSYTLESGWIELHLHERPEYSERFKLPAKRLKGSWYSLFSLWAREHYHWIHDVLLRLYQVLPLLPDDIQFLAPTALKPYQLESLDLLGIDRGKLTFYDGARPLKPDRLFRATPSAWVGNSSPGSVGWFRDLCAGSYGIPSETGCRVYISRARAGFRRLANEAELLPILEAYGFSVHFPETLSLADQVRLSLSAEIVVSTHGAGLTNMVFCRPGTRVMELFEPANVRGHYYALSDAAGLDYWCMTGDSVMNGAKEPDIYIEPSRFRSALKLLLHENEFQAGKNLA